MSTLYTWNTPNGQKPAILLEELEASYQLAPINITNGDQFGEEFLSVNPNGKIPALVDEEVTVFESGAIVQYLAEKYGAFLGDTGQGRASALAWSYWQVGGLGPTIGQWAHFAGAADLGKSEADLSYATDRFLKESIRLLQVLNHRLQESTYLAGNSYSIADVMSYPWVIGGLHRLIPVVGNKLPDLSATQRWIDDIAARPAVQRAISRLEQLETSSRQ